MQNVVQKLTLGSDNYMVGNSPLFFYFKTPANPDWSIAQQILTLDSIKDTYDNTTRTDYAQVVTELNGGRPVVINLANATGASEQFTITFTSAAFKDNSAALIPIGTIGINISGSTTPGVTHYITGMIIVNSGGVTAYMLNNPPPDILLKPIIIKTATISGDPAVNDVVTLTASEIYDTARNTAVSPVNLFANGTVGRRLVVYIQGAGLTLIPCELLPVYDTDYTTPVLFSGFTGIKFRGGSRTNYYGLYVKLASDGTLTATVEDRTVYNS